MKLIIPAILIIFSTNLLAEKPVITIAADPWCPWDCQSVNQQGFAVDFAHAIFDPLGYDVTFVAMPWARAIEEAKLGHITAIIGADKITEEVKTFVFPETPVGIMNNVYVLSNTSNFKYTTNEAMKGLKISIVSEYHFGGELGKYIDEHYQNKEVINQVSGSNAGEQNLKMLTLGRTDMYVDDIHVVNYLIAKNNLQNQVKIGGNLGDTVPEYIAFSPVLPNSKKMAAEFDAGMKRIKDSGELDQILKKYNL